MEAMIIGENMERRQSPQIDLASGAGPTVTPTGGSSLIQFIPGSDGSFVGTQLSSTLGPMYVTATTPASTTSVVEVTSTGPASVSAAAASETSAAGGAPSSINNNILIAVLVPVCVLLAAIPTAAYLIYVRRRDKKNREMEAEILRGRLAPSGASAHTADALLMRRSMSASSHREPKYPSVSTEDLDLATMEKAPRQAEVRDSANMFAPQQHGMGRRGGPGGIDTTPKPGYAAPQNASQSPTLPPLNFDKDPNERDLASVYGGKPSVPANLPTFAPAQTRRAPGPALAPAPTNTRSATASPAPAAVAQSPAIVSSKASSHVLNMDNPNWPLPAPSARDSASSAYSNSSSPAINTAPKPLPSGLSRELSPGSGAAPRNQATRTQQPGPRESSIAYGMPPMPPSPQDAQGESSRTKKRDSDAVSELSYTMSTRGKRDTRRDTDAISIISAMSDKDR